MINAFFDSWSLFANAWISAWLIAVLLGGLGVVMLARQQIFLGAAMAQAATCGVAIVLALVGGAGLSLLSGDWAHMVFGAVFAIATALITGVGRDHREAATAWIFLAGSAGSLVAVANDPHGSETITRLMASSLIGANASDVVVFSVLLGASLVLLWWRRRHLATIIIDPVYAAAIGLRVKRWEVVIAMWLGTAIGCALHTAGLLYAFGALLLPALAAREWARELRTMIWLAPLLALITAILGSVLANGWDLPPAQVTVLIMALLVPIVWGAGRLRRR